MMKTMFENLENGNLKRAKEQAKRFNFFGIKKAAMEIWGQDESSAYKIASYLRGLISFEEYCGYTPCRHCGGKKEFNLMTGVPNCKCDYGF
jgi:ferredoxin-thioredoxin reductase catalytic subunit